MLFVPLLEREPLSEARTLDGNSLDWRYINVRRTMIKGQSLVPLLEDPSRVWDRPAITTFGRGNHAVRSTRWRYIHYVDGSEELYDHDHDPHEWTNLAGDPQMKSILDAHRKWLPKDEQPILGKGSTGHAAYEAAAAELESK